MVVLAVQQEGEQENLHVRFFDLAMVEVLARVIVVAEAGEEAEGEKGALEYRVIYTRQPPLVQSGFVL